ncbi:MAG TPA: hypothetical protein VE944_12460 [Nostoc sp.]|uniref:hypothetical protein n=1 Tax=Nostoc sp. TaxID=1180 RepID=UPI002D70D834|nr:hypothetical protein [Nostoc sp.]HYX15155.1 hypothetical protein [Nostoc sp.]
MSRQKRTYRVLEKAEFRTAGLKAIDPTMDFGNGRNLESMTQLIELPISVNLSKKSA